ncbi:MAG: DUF1579 domain-containing protein [Gemmatimonadaceae bacterium]|nr:DUF1579 domain-containing protein [Chitinophagaceae bacterium]
MKKVTIASCFAFCIAFTACNDAGTTDTTAAAADTSVTAAASDTTTEPIASAAPMDSAAAMKAWMEYSTPGEMHKLLSSGSGAWKAEMTMWMDPQAPPTKSVAKEVNRMILGGRYQESKYTGSFEGQPFEGIGTMAYDNATKKFISTWIDNMGTGLMKMEGTYDPSTKTLSQDGVGVDPTTGKDCKMRSVVTYIDDTHRKMEMYNAKPGQKEFKSMEIVLTKM